MAFFLVMIRETSNSYPYQWLTLSHTDVRIEYATIVVTRLSKEYRCGTKECPLPIPLRIVLVSIS